ncbi:hypothetical protein NPD8_3883 (plasmid) [Clostridium botulinum]|uniref:Uncharacterized protein n=1 Tax=Clostridium botulinum TaxID=1491 RepID=A0A1L7JN28_CLOBO|nr:hypothetical protein NPD8_3883 [Clostridium botulinum]
MKFGCISTITRSKNSFNCSNAFLTSVDVNCDT